MRKPIPLAVRVALSMRALGAALVLALSALALGPGAARAVTVTEYEVTVEGEADYARTDFYPVQPSGTHYENAEAGFKWRSRWPSVMFFGKDVHYTSEPSTQVSEINAAIDATITNPAGTVSGACSGTTLAAPAGGTWLGGGAIPTPDPNMESIGVRVLGGVQFHLPSCSGLYSPGPQSLPIGSDRPIPMGPFDTVFDMPHEAIGMGKIIQLLDADVSGESCPGHHANTTSCTLTWKATVTFVRTHQWQTDPPPAPSANDDSLIPMPPPRPAEDNDDSLIPMPPPRAKLSPDGKRAELSLTCPVACQGTAAAHLLARGARASAVRPLVTVGFRSAADRPTKVVLRFGPRARRAIERAGGVRIELRISPAAGGKALRRSLVLRPERPRRGA